MTHDFAWGYSAKIERAARGDARAFLRSPRRADGARRLQLSGSRAGRAGADAERVRPAAATPHLAERARRNGGRRSHARRRRTGDDRGWRAPDVVLLDQPRVCGLHGLRMRAAALRFARPRDPPRPVGAGERCRRIRDDRGRSASGSGANGLCLPSRSTPRLVACGGTVAGPDDRSGRGDGVVCPSSTRLPAAVPRVRA